MPCEPAGRSPRPVYPFAALAGQERMKRALLANAVCPDIGGVLLRGEKGTAKSTAVRGLAAVLPEIDVVAGCACGCAPGGPFCPDCAEARARGRDLPAARRPIRVVDLPLGATEDRLAGGLDLEAAVRRGVRAFAPGLLAAAHRGILYVDEVNLLPDHLVDLVLDAAASGVNVVEREGVSLAHPARFILAGSMNPEEGELRPQLLDRFGLCVEVAAPRDPDARLAVLRSREAYDLAPDFFRQAHEPGQKRLARSLAQARARLPRVRMPEELERLCSELAREANVAGHRADLALRRAALALAALDGLDAATEALVREAAALALPHRMRMAPPPPPPQSEEHPRQQEQPRDQEQQEQ
ncbi:MAG: ATP-binding protein, partial [Thermodesulfobacteriota bacterium]